MLSKVLGISREFIEASVDILYEEQVFKLKKNVAADDEIKK